MKRLFTILFSLMLTASLYAQTDNGFEGFYLQPKMGANIATITNVVRNDPRVGVVLGLDFEYKPENVFGISLGVNYSMQGDRYMTNSSKIIRKLDYITVPVMGIANISPWFAIKIGIQPAFNVFARKNVSSGLTGKEYTYEALGVHIEDVDFSVPVGVAFTFPNGFTLEARYNAGVTDIFEGSKNHNSVFQFTLGQKFKL